MAKGIDRYRNKIINKQRGMTNEATIKLTPCANRLLLIVATAITLIYYIALSSTYFHTSKIEEGTVVVRNDTITTIIIPDKR